MGVPVDVVNEFALFALRLLIEDEKLTRKKFDMLGQKSGHITHESAVDIMDVRAM